jgi:hypothetical protein
MMTRAPLDFRPFLKEANGFMMYFVAKRMD